MSVNTQAWISMSKLGEGGFYMAFRLLIDDGSIVIARLPSPNAGPSYLTAALEVAAMDFITYFA
jgi:hypothetical protein